MELGVVPSPNTIFKNIRKVAPGQLINFQFNDSNIEAQKSQYWEIEDYVSYEEFNEKNFTHFLMRLFQFEVKLMFQ